MKYLLDTNICIYLIKRKPASVIERFYRLAPGEVCISVVTLYELSYGAYKSTQVERNVAAIHQFTAPLEVAPFDPHDADVCARLRAVLESRGQVIGPTDLQIAAQAVARKHILVTNTLREFERIEELQLENWAD